MAAQSSLRVASLTVVGATTGTLLEIPDNVQTKPQGIFDEAVLHRDLTRLIERYAADGFVYARIDSVTIIPAGGDSAVDIFVRIHEGKPALLKSIDVEGVRAVKEEDLKARFELAPGGLFSPSALESDIQRGLTFCEQSGYPFAKLAVKDVSFSEAADAILTSVILSVDEGQRVTISELRVEGNKSTKEYVILREARLQPDEIFDGRLPERIKRRLERLALFSSVSLPELYLTESGHGGLLVRVAEGSPNSFDGLIGYVPTRQQESGFFTGLVHVQFRNLLGTGRKLSTRWYRENQLTQEVEIRYFEPWIASYPFNGLVDFFQRRQDSTYVRRNYGLSLEFMVSEVLMFGVAYSQANVIPSEGYARSILAESRQWSVGGHVRYDTRDDPVTPTGGVLYRTEYRSGVKNTLNNLTNAPAARSSTRLVTMDLSQYFPFFSRQVLATEFHLRDFRADRIEVADLFKLGGATSLRGYKEGQFQGSTLSWMNAEYRFLAGSRSFFYIFADVGYVVVPENVAGGLSKSEQTKAGFGVGVRMESGLGLIGVNLGFGEGDTFSTAKLHVRLVNEF
ncbi:MAG: BamA/TamA family outer membrane protein [Ignavibacteriales bacterium]|nr:BamA/TamA family outer membrane protein [Ignavibacteriales bacterium]